MRLLYIGGRVPRIGPCVVLEAAVFLRKEEPVYSPLLSSKIGLLGVQGMLAGFTDRQEGCWT